MISGDGMKKYVIVKQKHLYTNERNLMFEGYAGFSKNESCITLEYIEKDQKTKVCVIASDDELQIKRNGEIVTHLYFTHKEKTMGTIMSEFGMIEIDIFTHKYIKKENIIAIEYDILSGNEMSDGYRIIWTIKEDFS